MENTSQEAIKISRISILVNLLLSAGKLAAGLLAHSGAMISDAVHSASDVFSTLVVIVGVKLSGKDSDREHPYGHERMECVAAILLSGILLATGLVIGWEGIQKILSERAELRAPGILAAAAALVSILVKELLFRYVRGSRLSRAGPPGQRCDLRLHRQGRGGHFPGRGGQNGGPQLR